MIPKKLIEEISRWIKEGRYGNIQINFSGGKIANINLFQSLKVDQLTTNSIDTKIEVFSIQTCEFAKDDNLK